MSLPDEAEVLECWATISGEHEWIEVSPPWEPVQIWMCQGCGEYSDNHANPTEG